MKNEIRAIFMKIFFFLFLFPIIKNQFVDIVSHYCEITNVIHSNNGHFVTGANTFQSF